MEVSFQSSTASSRHIAPWCGMRCAQSVLSNMRCHQNRKTEMERDAQAHRETDGAQYRNGAPSQHAKHQQRGEHANQRSVQRAPLLSGIAGVALEEQRVMQAKARRENQRDQVKQRDLDATYSLHSEHEERCECH